MPEPGCPDGRPRGDPSVAPVHIGEPGHVDPARVRRPAAPRNSPCRPSSVRARRRELCVGEGRHARLRAHRLAVHGQVLRLEHPRPRLGWSVNTPLAGAVLASSATTPRRYAAGAATRRGRRRRDRDARRPVIAEARTWPPRSVAYAMPRRRGARARTARSVKRAARPSAASRSWRSTSMGSPNHATQPRIRPSARSASGRRER
jgi:hypothetical protein